MAGTNFEGFSVSHAAILDGTTPVAGTNATATDIYGVREGSIEVDTDSFDNTGDDTVLSTWNWFNFATLTVSSGFIPFSIVALLSGTSVYSSGSGAATQYSLPLWNESSLAVAPKPVLIRVPSKDQDGVARTLDFILYKVEFQPIAFDGPAYKDGLVCNYSGKALMSTSDEAGTALTTATLYRPALSTGDRAIGRIVNWQRAGASLSG